MTLIELLLWLAVPTVYVTLVMLLARWVASLLEVPPVVVALPLAMTPLLAVFGRGWRHSWILVAPVSVAVLLVGLVGGGQDWRATAGTTAGVVFCWIWLLMVLGAARRKVRRKS